MVIIIIITLRQMLVMMQARVIRKLSTTYLSVLPLATGHMRTKMGK